MSEILWLTCKYFLLFSNELYLIVHQRESDACQFAVEDDLGRDLR